jgi:hypothetical protein
MNAYFQSYSRSPHLPSNMGASDHCCVYSGILFRIFDHLPVSDRLAACIHDESNRSFFGEALEVPPWIRRDDGLTALRSHHRRNSVSIHDEDHFRIMAYYGDRAESDNGMENTG